METSTAVDDDERQRGEEKTFGSDIVEVTSSASGDHRRINAMERLVAEGLVDAKEESESLESALREARRREKALEEQNFRLESTVDLLVEDHRNATESLVDAEEESELLESALREARR